MKRQIAGLWYEAGHLIVRFRRSRSAAGNPSTYNKIALGNAAWVGRPLNANEPTMLKQKMTEAQATTAIKRLRQNGGFWRFYCRANPAGYFDVSRSEATYASVQIDPGSRKTSQPIAERLNFAPESCR